MQQAKARSNPLNFGSGGSGSPAHLAGHALVTAGGFKASHIAYKGSPESLIGLIGGQVEYLVTTSATAIPLIKAGKIRALAITSPRRTDQLPDVPTVAEALPNGFVFEAWGMLMAPAQTPKPIIDKLRAAMQTAMQEPATVEFLNKSATRAEIMSPQQLPEFLRSEDRKNCQLDPRGRTAARVASRESTVGKAPCAGRVNGMQLPGVAGAGIRCCGSQLLLVGSEIALIA